MGAAHPLTELNPLWRRFHGIDRPTGPTAEEFLATLSELDIEPTTVRWRRQPEAEYATFAELTDVTRRRLCLPADAEPESATALRELGVDPDLPPDLGSSGRDLVTVSWLGRAGRLTAATRSTVPSLSRSLRVTSNPAGASNGSRRADGTVVEPARAVDVPLAVRLDFTEGKVWFVGGDEIMVVFSPEKIRDMGFKDITFLQ